MADAFRLWLDEAWSVDPRDRLSLMARDRVYRAASDRDAGEGDVRFGAVRVCLTDRSGRSAPVHIGYDTLWLLELATAVEPADRAAELGTGSGVVAAALGMRWPFVAATEIVGPVALTAARTGRLNRGSPGVVRADAGSGLRLGAFDLVVANPPYLPTGDEERPWADGGPTGAELPSRFAFAASDLLAPGGLGIVLFLDTLWDDGRRPILGLLDALRVRCAAVEVTRCPSGHRVERLEFGSRCRRVRGLVDAELVAIRLTV